MSINQLQMLARIKSNLLEIADVLLTDEVKTKEEVACELLMEIDSMNGLEESMVKDFRKTTFKRVCDKVDEIELEREKKRP